MEKELSYYKSEMERLMLNEGYEYAPALHQIRLMMMEDGIGMREAVTITEELINEMG